KPSCPARRKPASTATPLPWLTGRRSRTTRPPCCAASASSTAAQAAVLPSSTRMTGTRWRSRPSSTAPMACSWLYTGTTTHGLNSLIAASHGHPAAGVGANARSVGKTQALLAVLVCQLQLHRHSGPDHLLELQLVHALEQGRQRKIPAAI